MKNDTDIYYRYPGTKPFKPDEFLLFRGRDEDIQNLYELISIQNLIVLYGRSGLGKSSLLNAGLTRRLKDDDNTSAIFIRFGAHFTEEQAAPLEKLNEIIQEEYQPDFENFLFKKLVPDTNSSVLKLWYLFKSLQIKNNEVNTFILIFDQFEELFTYRENEVSLFKKELSELFYEKVPQQIRNLLKNKLLSDKNYLTKEEAALLFNPLNIKIIFSIRSDKLSLLNNLSDVFPAVLKSYYELKPLNRLQAKQAIEIPAQLTDKPYAAPPYTFDESTLNLILDSLTGSKKQENIYSEEKQGIETFQLQIVCKYAENLVIKKSIKIISKTDLGNIKEIFEDHYTNIIKELSLKDQLPARKLIEEKLIIDGSRVCMPVPFLMNNMKDEGMTTALLDELINTHILRPEHNNAVEISHDTLIEPILKSREKRIAEQKKKKFFIYKVVAGSIVAGLLIVAIFSFFKYNKQQISIDINHVKDSIKATVTDSVKQEVKATVLDSIGDRKKADSLANIRKADSLLKNLIARYQSNLRNRIDIQYKCYYKKDADDNLLTSLINTGYTNTHWSQAKGYKPYKPNALFYGTEVPLEDVKIIALSMIKAGYKLQRVADIIHPTTNTIQIWISPENMNQAVLTETEIENAESKAALNRGTKIPGTQQ